MMNENEWKVGELNLSYRSRNEEYYINPKQEWSSRMKDLINEFIGKLN